MSLGEVKNPVGRNFADQDGLIGVASSILILIVVVAGVFALFNFVTAGLNIITSQGDPKSMEAARQKIYMSFIGLAIIASSFLLAGVVGLIFFGDASVFLSPTIYGPDQNFGG